MKKYSLEWWQAQPPEKVGKETEKIVEKLFIEWNHSQAFAWHRMPDARAARGRLAAQPADYLYRCGEHAGFIEVKALKHEYRLPKDRVSQLPTLLKWNLAGSDDLILVFHYMIGKWRWMFPHQLETDVPSWDLSCFVTFDSAEEALKSTGYFNVGEQEE
jgi:hypothetical protein